MVWKIRVTNEKQCSYLKQLTQSMHKMQIQPTMCIVFYLISVFDLFSFKHLKYTQSLICSFISVLFSSSGKDSLKNNVFVLSVFHSDISEARVSQSCHVGLRAPVLSWYHSLCCKSSHTEQPQRSHHQPPGFITRCISVAPFLRSGQK